jgi:hypothetical protein
MGPFDVALSNAEVCIAILYVHESNDLTFCKHPFEEHMWICINIAD